MLFLHYENIGLYVNVLRAADGAPHDIAFSDLRSILQAGACWRQGINVYEPSLCMHGGVFNYAPLLLRASYLPIGPNNTNMLGLLVDLAFIASYGFFPSAKSHLELFFRVLVSISPASLFVMERANFDVAIFVFMATSIFLLERKFLFRNFSYGIIMLSAGFKFYPLVAMVVLIRERLASFIILGCISFLLIWVYLGYFYGDTRVAVSILPHGSPFGEMFGSINIVYGLSLMIWPPSPLTISSIINYPLSNGEIIFLDVLRVCALFSAAFMARYYVNLEKKCGDHGKVGFVIGAFLISGSFLIAQNVDYRGIFFVFTMPYLYQLCGTATARMVSRFGLVFSIIFLVWEPCIRHSGFRTLSLVAGNSLADTMKLYFWYFREILWWLVVINLLAIAFSILIPFLKIKLDESLCFLKNISPRATL